MPPAVVAFTREVKHLVENRCRSIVRRVRPPAFVRFSRRCLQQHNLVAELSDKDGVFVILRETTAESLTMAELQNTVLQALQHACLRAELQVGSACTLGDVSSL